VHAEDQDRQVGREIARLLEHIEAVAPGDRQIEHHEAPALLAHQLQRRRSARRLAEDRGRQVLGQELAHPAPQDGVVVDQQDAQLGRVAHGRA
jgi:hypothetical protein